MNGKRKTSKTKQFEKDRTIQRKNAQKNKQERVELTFKIKVN